MSLPIPNNREQVYLSKVIDKNLENIPIPISRFEMYLKCLLDFDKDNLPTPISKQELILYDYILGNECNVLASNKTEMFLKALSTVEVAGLPTPQSKIDVFLDYIIRNGCLERFEYYPFTIRDYLNVKNTPKAKMKFKGAKGNTLILNPSGEIVLPGTSGAIIKSFGESENKIEVLSDNNLQGELNQSSKATLMYRNSSNELLPIPILRGKWDGDRFLWGDEILLHEDGQLYYHKRCFVKIFYGTEKFTLDGERSKGNTNYFRENDKHSIITSNSIDSHFINNKLRQVSAGNNWSTTYDGNCIDINNDNDNGVGRISIRYDKASTGDVSNLQALLKQWYDSGNPLTIIMQLTEEEVYPCELSEQLYSYDGETNIFINGGGVMGETTIEIGTKLGPIVDSIRQNVDRSTRAIEGLVSYGVQECAYQLYPEDFKNVPSVIEGEKNA